VEVTRLDLPASLIGRPLTLTAGDNGLYELLDPDGAVILQGEAGAPAAVDTPAGRVEIFVQTFDVDSPAVEFELLKRPWLSVVESLAERVSIAEKGRDTGILQISLEGEDRAFITGIVNTIADTYVRQNVEARSAEAEKSLAFLDSQLPELRAQLQAAEERFSEFREDRQAADLDQQGQALLDQLVELENRRSQLDLKLAELQQSYAGQHPALQAVREQQRRLSEDRVGLEDRIGKLPEAQKEILRLRRDVEVYTALYTALLNRAQELRVLKAGTTGNVRIIDRAVEPIEPIAPRSSLVLAVSLALGAACGVVLTFAAAILRRGVTDPRDIEAAGLPIYAIIPFSAWLAKRSTSRRPVGAAATMPILARDHPDEPTVEGLRSMRTNLYFASGQSDKAQVVIISGPAPGVGKSFVSLNLGYLLGQVGQRAVVIDADLRKGRLHEFTGAGRGVGLSQLLAGHASLDDVLRPVDGEALSLITTGTLPPNPAELLMRDAFPQVIEELRERFDVVIVDGPPILAVTDAAVICGALPDAIPFLVVRAGLHPLAEIEESARRLGGADRRIAGVIFNGLREEHVRYGGREYAYYRYEYRPESA
jgi:tyrosine-protein kinase Etk/Wzc